MRVVILSDSRLDREALAQPLMRAGNVVEQAADAASGARCVAKELTHVVIFAWPNDHGADLVRRLRAADESGQAYLLAVIDGARGARDIPVALDFGGTGQKVPGASGCFRSRRAIGDFASARNRAAPTRRACNPPCTPTSSAPPRCSIDARTSTQRLPRAASPSRATRSRSHAVSGRRTRAPRS